MEEKSFIDQLKDSLKPPKPASPPPDEDLPEIDLFETFVAGTSHVDGIADLAEFLEEGERLNFVREPENVYDSQAIRIETEDGVKLGYVPKRDNPIFARLMDAGQILYGRITDYSFKNRWLKINIRIYLEKNNA